MNIDLQTEYWLANCEYWLANYEYWLANYEYWLANCEYWLANYEYWLANCEYWLANCEYWLAIVLNIDLQTVNIDLQTVNIDLLTVKIDMQTVGILGFLFRQKLSLSCKTLLHSSFNELNSFFQVWDSWELYDSCPFLIYSPTWTFSTPTPSYVSHILSLCSWVFGCQREDSFTW